LLKGKNKDGGNAWQGIKIILIEKNEFFVQNNLLK
jgi:hypothetical protein